MKNEKVPLLRSDDLLIVPVPGELNDLEMQQFEATLLAKVTKDEKVRNVILDVSSLRSIDLYAARMFVGIIKKLKLLDLDSVLVGLRPEVAITMTDIGLTLPNVKSAINLEHAIKLLDRLKKQ